MGERGPRPIPVTVVGPDGERGAMTRGMYSFLLLKGIIRGQLDDQRAAGLDEFQPALDITDTLKPIQRSTEIRQDNNAATSLLISTIEAPEDRILVIRALSWRVTGDVPLEYQVAYRGRVDDAGQVETLVSIGPLPSTGRIIGDVASDLTAEFNRLLPYAILPGGRVQFAQRFGVNSNANQSINFLQELHLSPFRPAGL